MTTVLTAAVARLLLAPLLAVSVAVLVKGYSAVGDGFTAGLIAVLGVLIQYVTFGPDTVERRLPVRYSPYVAFAGLLIVLAVAAQSVLRSRPLLVHAPGSGTEPTTFGTLELTTPFAFDVGIFLLVLGGALTAVHAVARIGPARG